MLPRKQVYSSIWRRLQQALVRRCTQEDSKVDGLAADSAPRAHTPTNRMFWGAHRNDGLLAPPVFEIQHQKTRCHGAQADGHQHGYECWGQQINSAGPAAGSIGTSDLKLV